MSSHRSGSMNYTQNSGSHYSAAAVLAQPLQSYEMPGFSRWMNTAAPLLVDTRGYPFFSTHFLGKVRNSINYARGPAGGPGTTCSGSYTFYQRVYDNINTFWCYYSGSTVNESPGMTDTTPHNSGDISGYSIVYVTEQIVCS